MFQSFESLNSRKVFRFGKTDVQDILNTLGIHKNSVEEVVILKQYQKSTDFPLLTLLIRTLINRSLAPSSESEQSFDAKFAAEKNSIGTRWNTCVQYILQKSLARGSNVYAIRDRILRFFIMEFDRFKSEADAKCETEIERSKEPIFQELKCKELEFKTSELQLKNTFVKERETLLAVCAEKDIIINEYEIKLKEQDKVLRKCAELEDVSIFKFQFKNLLCTV